MGLVARITPLAAALCLASVLAACGSSSSKTGGSETLATLTLTSTSDGATTGAAAPADCATTVASTLGEVGQRIYRQAAAGRGVAEAVARVKRSPALASALASGDPLAAAASLEHLLANQIARIEILKGGHAFASAGTGSAIAPVRGTFPGTDASYVLSVQADTSYMKVTKQVTGSEVLLLSTPSPASPGARQLAGTLSGLQPARIPARGTLEYKNKKYATFSLAGSVYPSGPLRIVLLVPQGAVRCGGSAEQTRVATLGHVGELIYQEEAGSPYVKATLRHIEADHGFQQAVGKRDLAATRGAIVGSSPRTSTSCACA
jgi:hypothetical protein